MQDTIDILDYEVHWKSKSDTGFIGELWHIAGNSSGGSLNTPVGYLIAFIEPSSEYSSAYWKVLMSIREVIRYNIEDSTTHVFVESAYANKQQYNALKLKESTEDIIRINPNLLMAIKDELINANIISSPLAIQMTIGKDESYYSDVEFDFD